jgi:hypothetical protein
MINPMRLNTPQFGKPLFGPTSLMAVAGATDPKHQIPRIIDEVVDGRITEQNIPEADVYAMSFLSTCRKGAFRTADIIRRVTGKPVIAGGIDVTGVTREQGPGMMLEHFDAIVVGALTRRLWAEVLSDCANKKIKPVYQMETGEPFEFHSLRYDLIDQRKYRFIAIQSSAGCYNNCPFCAVFHIIGKRNTVYTRPPEDIAKDLAGLRSGHFADISDSFGSDYDHTIDVLEVYRKSGKKWATEATVKTLMGRDDGTKHPNPRRRELITPMANSGCVIIYMGIETLVGKVSGKSEGPEFYEQAAALCRKAGMMTAGSCLLDGVAAETPESIREMVKWMQKHFDFGQFSLTALLPGTPLREFAVENGFIVDDNSEHMGGAHPTILHRRINKEGETNLNEGMTAQVRLEAMAETYITYYGWPYIIERLRRTSRSMFLMSLAVNVGFHIATKKWWRENNYETWLATKEDYVPPK